MTYEEQLKKEKDVQLGNLCEEWLDKIGNDFFQKEKQQILCELENAMPSDLITIQARLRAVQKLSKHITSIINTKKSSARKLYESRRE